MRTDLIHQNDVVAAIPRMSRRAFRASRLFTHWLKIHEVRLSHRNIYFPRAQVLSAFKMEKIPVVGL